MKQVWFGASIGLETPLEVGITNLKFATNSPVPILHELTPKKFGQLVNL
jgi:hypothetical protein